MNYMMHRDNYEKLVEAFAEAKAEWDALPWYRKAWRTVLGSLQVLHSSWETRRELRK